MTSTSAATVVRTLEFCIVNGGVDARMRGRRDQFLHELVPVEEYLDVLLSLRESLINLKDPRSTSDGTRVTTGVAKDFV